MNDLATILPLTFIPLFVAVDPFWVTAVYAPYAAGKPASTVLWTATKATLTALGVSLVFAFVGQALFGVLGITVDDFKVAGGLLLLVVAIVDLMSPGRSILGDGDASVFPLGTPLIAGPALLTTLLVLMEHYGTLPTVVGLMLNMLVLWLSMASVRLLGGQLPHPLLVALSKIMSVLLASIAVMMIRLGLTGILEGLIG